MNTTSIALVSVFTGGMAGGMSSAIAQAAELPLEKLVGLGSGGIVSAVVFFLMRHYAAQDQQKRLEHAEDIKQHLDASKHMATEFATATKNLGETTATMLRETRDEAAKREERLAVLFDRLVKDKP